MRDFMSQRKFKIIIIDDESMVSEMLKDYPEDYEISVSTASSGEDGSGLIAREDFAFAIVDIRLTALTAMILL